MARAQGARAQMALAFETVYGTPPAGGFTKMPFASTTLGGLCDWVEAEAPRPVDLPVEGAASLKAAVIPVVLHYSTADQLA